ncbi:MAG: cytochrome P450 [Proteobacteria bacterium]|nr:cytochrome P450 [Pseudomonadota bacterium]
MKRDESALDALDITDVERYRTRGYPWAAWDRLRREAPIYWYERPGHAPFWAVTRHADILTISRASDVFVSTRRLRIFPEPLDSQIVHTRLEDARKVGWIESAPLSFIDMDDPEHTTYRRVISRFFTPRAMNRQQELIDGVADRRVSLLERRLDEGPNDAGVVEFVDTVAVHVPATVLFEMLGVEEALYQQILDEVDDAVRSSHARAEARLPVERPRFTIDSSRVARMMQDALDRREAAGADTDCLLDVILRARVDGERVTPRQRLAMANMVLFAGLETTRNAIAGGVYTLLKRRDQLERLVADPGLVDTASEEVLRWISPVIHFARTAVQDFELSGTRIRAGEAVGMFYPSANRDESVFEDPYRFDVARRPNDHLAFGGYGTHFCLGANLARWQIRATLRRLLPLLPELELVGEPVWDGGLHVGGYTDLQLRRAA